MTREIIAAALEAEGLKPGAQGAVVPEDREVTFFVETRGEVLHVSKVVKIDLRDKYVFLQSGKDERYYFPYEAVLGLRLLGAPKERAAGFAR